MIPKAGQLVELGQDFDPANAVDVDVQTVDDLNHLGRLLDRLAIQAHAIKGGAVQIDRDLCGNRLKRVLDLGALMKFGVQLLERPAFFPDEIISLDQGLTLRLLLGKLGFQRCHLLAGRRFFPGEALQLGLKARLLRLALLPLVPSHDQMIDPIARGLDAGVDLLLPDERRSLAFEIGELCLEIVQRLAAFEGAELPLGLVQGLDVIGQVVALMFKRRDLIVEVGKPRLDVLVAPPGFAAPIDDLEGEKVDIGQDGVDFALIAELFDLGRDRLFERVAGAVRERRLIKGLALGNEHDAEMTGAALVQRQGAIPFQMKEVLDGKLGLVPLRHLAVRAGQPCHGAAKKAFFDLVEAALDLDLDRNTRSSALDMVRLQRLDRLGLRAVAFKQRGAQGQEQGRLTHLVGAGNQVQPIGKAFDENRLVELLELLDPE